ncbi:DNA-3-methyladenine glycosylase family protein [Candidatus Nanosalina sp. VS9-1]|uniref:DNA-3-methyladenine glycosylase family protein n=1 Tax=Candidatus Nanosalina sp. VS9-1 TaxID=3388566 RepID=UPI0039E1A4AE
MKPPEKLREDEKLRPLIEEHGELELEASENPFERMVTSIVNQQLSTQSAEAIRSRLFDNFEISPEALLDADKEELADVGLSRQKIDYIRSAARHFIEDDLSVEKFSNMSDEEVIDELTDIHGVGDWTAKMFMISVLAREDVFPVEDLGIRRAMEEVYGLESRGEMREKAEDWRPYRGLASRYLWRAVD